ncbi:hypothetical protein C2G38_2228464 [Gigaspora rosea]|uniref:Uncharacterized protein n=1 Tax=Gigaspora rosea TaxID=44941 RepID=A0A397TZH1_9GLOM|nr:hypothetical protein C2G38_2228464 [Gigaspora rosea]
MVNMKNVKDMFEKNKEIIFLPGLLLKETLQENLDYISKIYKRCKIYYNSLKNQYCKYSLFDLNNFGRANKIYIDMFLIISSIQKKYQIISSFNDCKICTIECCKQQKKKLLDEKGSGPFEFGRYRFLLGSSYETQTTFVSSPQNLKKILMLTKKLRKKILREDGGQRDGYDKQEIVFLDEFYTKISWDDVVNILNNTTEGVEHKGKGFRQPFIPKYIFMTARKSLQESYNFGNRSNNEDSY